MAIVGFGRRGSPARFTTAPYLPEPELGRSPIACGLHAAMSTSAVIPPSRALVWGQDLHGQDSQC